MTSRSSEILLPHPKGGATALVTRAFNLHKRIQRTPWQERRWLRTAYLVGLIQSMQLSEQAMYYKLVRDLRTALAKAETETEWSEIK